jgi:site-specific DNA-methyltransferase (adenine-specific)
MRWLCRLITPPGGHILEPFAGSGTTGIAAMAEGFDCSMIELEADHVADIERKLAFLRGEGALTFQEHNHAKALRTKETPLGGLFGEAV